MENAKRLANRYRNVTPYLSCICRRVFEKLDYHQIMAAITGGTEVALFVGSTFYESSIPSDIKFK